MSNYNENPWEDQESQQQRQRQAQNQYQDQSHNPFTHGQNTASQWTQEPSQGYAPPDHPPPSHMQPGGLNQHPPHQQQQQQPFNPNSQGGAGNPSVAPGLPPRRTGTDLALPTGQDRSHQIEVLQSYEAGARKDDDDANVETLQREFPKLDGSLIAAIYGDSKSLSATREMLQALGDE